MSNGCSGSPDSGIDQKALASEMLEFCRAIPRSADLEWVKEWDFLYYFEAERLMTMRRALLDAGLGEQSPLRVLDFGYLHGLVPEFLHRFFPAAQFSVLDHPRSPNFSNPEYLDLIGRRSYLKLSPGDITKVTSLDGEFDLILLGEIIEHLDPTVAAGIFSVLRGNLRPGGRLLITTPNGAGIKNSVLTFAGRDAQHPPVPDKTMNFGHIHLWTPNLLERTLRHYGWTGEQTIFSHGFERWDFDRSNRHWGSFRHQLLTKVLYLAAEIYPRWRGFMVSTWKPAGAISVNPV